MAQFTKAGKVRHQTPKIKAAEHTSLGPRQRIKRRHRLMMLQERLSRRGKLEYEHVKGTHGSRRDRGSW